MILQNALDLTISQTAMETAAVEGEEAPAAAESGEQEVPAWAQVSLAALKDNGICLEANSALTRGDVAQVLYQVSYLAIDAPGMAVIRMQNIRS